ncbi:MAG TPA: efflux RND transporter periplasmic adaptor subunit [Verrucomicrobiae bacterium]|nr:efflux RND transporter periplasmic adaptor subunit [Verrucomicrobiae bacterium]
MSETTENSLSKLQIAPEKKARGTAGPVVVIVLVVGVLVVGLAVFVLTRSADRQPIATHASAATAAMASVPAPPPKPGESVLTVSGYVVPHERIEISPRFQGTVKWIGVKKGDDVKKGEVMVLLEDDEYRARVMEGEGRLALAQANLTNAEINLKRQIELSKNDVDSARALDDAQRERDAAVAEVKIASGQLALARTYLGWCTIRAPIDGTILEKLVDPNELVVPQSFGGTRGPSTALVSLADLNDLQVEIDLNEADTPKVRMNQRCQVSPEAYPNKKYAGYVAEIAPEANRSKGTLQVKVQVEKPDKFLTPELTARVDFLAD